jgi:integrase/recombinase XerD
MNDQLPTPITPTDRRLTAAQFRGLAEVPPEIEWFANITNLGTRRIYKIAIQDFMRFTGKGSPVRTRLRAGGSRIRTIGPSSGEP